MSLIRSIKNLTVVAWGVSVTCRWTTSKAMDQLYGTKSLPHWWQTPKTVRSPEQITHGETVHVRSHSLTIFTCLQLEMNSVNNYVVSLDYKEVLKLWHFIGIGGFLSHLFFNIEWHHCSQSTIKTSSYGVVLSLMCLILIGKFNYFLADKSFHEFSNIPNNNKHFVFYLGTSINFICHPHWPSLNDMQDQDDLYYSMHESCV